MLICQNLVQMDKSLGGWGERGGGGEGETNVVFISNNRGGLFLVAV